MKMAISQTKQISADFKAFTDKQHHTNHLWVVFFWKELAIVALICIVAFESYRLGLLANNNYAALVNEFEGYKVAAQAEYQREVEAFLQNANEKLRVKDQENEALRNTIITITADYDNASRLLNTTKIHLRQAQSRADSGSCEDARQAARMCTDVSTELASRTQEAERRAGVYAEYADKLEIELRAARGMIGKKEK